MNIAFRTDASLQIGSGHVMRCLTLADALQAAGEQCHFICREQPGHLIAQIRQRGFAVTVLPMMATEALSANEQGSGAQSNYAAWLGADWATDAAQTKADMDESAIDWLIVDHYALDARWEQTLRPQCRKLMVIDDLADRPHDCDLLLDQNLGRDAVDYSRLVPEHCRVLAGAGYALLRPEFAALREESLRRRAVPQLKQLLITMGGVDQADATGKVLEALKDCLLPINLRITVVMGAHAPWLERVKMLAKQLPQTTEVKVNVDNMAQLMADSDLAIGAAGSTSWERCCLGLPTILVVLADNQRKGAAALEQHGSVRLLGDAAAIPGALQSTLGALVSADALNRLSRKSCLITDGQGTIRVLDALNGCQD
ncbi:MAG: UDP-2,4-diacetamido-2,4,6-trideoxy-beta-L-altropyranose hydrolase [Methylobacter sp.]|nr:UDP-2,4-diacetamido-2,4,6-trideoxy-beta-L-altropyranose hydrolase [Methylobacter sp.]MDP2097067.1 UDP-2,4-diacetamido-2,4,6-trideoxy-beta-L-altropyranose hydrolase [Methylobacter sp.]MDP2428005.1 UDP-2,4-diacetamido-2,4,6-trideoxy-beta-L-altropyranose hydrolase [Methylobacter sp.]MDP3055901.1 UDP-2,4-diacetamido-2,4,6-trideoxy-beta-L-altropyranose hydrolase [Methylobacter sp.]MDP3363059.1 UDP-2,4-diacetamido-2,4,6-trideoxy-beta-L-altropyranose hydrolase [Methylobacter sp.]